MSSITSRNPSSSKSRSSPRQRKELVPRVTPAPAMKEKKSVLEENEGKRMNSSASPCCNAGHPRKVLPGAVPDKARLSPMSRR